MIPEGTYRARAVEGALGRTSKGTEQVALQFTVVDGEQKGHSITWYGYFSEKTLERTLESLEYCGWEGDDLSDLTGIDRNEVSIVVEHEQDEQGQVRARIRWINSGGGIAMKERMDEGDAKAFAQRMRGAVLGRRAGKPTHAAGGAQQRQTRQSQQRPQQAPPPTDDDIPF
jgi:hypothetical protein